ncbi:hypothetical protein CL615_00110 [archaeon]|mgnify:CR=1 FL=1|nr:hypothetical protein [archaeon]
MIYFIKNEVFKIKNRYFLVIVLAISLIFLISCTKSECKTDAQCLEKTCAVASCIDKQCKYTTTKNCCGNQVKETVENNKPGNKCTCPADYGKCDGKVQLTKGSRSYDAKYLEYFCENEECKSGVPSEDVAAKTLLDERDFKFFELETTVKFNDPFDIGKDRFDFRMSIIDENEDIVFPIKMNKIILKDGEVFLGEKNLDLFLNKVGESISFNVQLSYDLVQPEESRGLTYKVNYEYTKRVVAERLPDGSESYGLEFVRDDYEKRFSTKVNLVRSEVK